jgi:hypothetical protein
MSGHGDYDAFITSGNCTTGANGAVCENGGAATGTAPNCFCNCSTASGFEGDNCEVASCHPPSCHPPAPPAHGSYVGSYAQHLPSLRISLQISEINCCVPDDTATSGDITRDRLNSVLGSYGAQLTALADQIAVPSGCCSASGLSPIDPWGWLSGVANGKTVPTMR